jgi:hypothetical protein
MEWPYWRLRADVGDMVEWLMKGGGFYAFKIFSNFGDMVLNTSFICFTAMDLEIRSRYSFS